MEPMASAVDQIAAGKVFELQGTLAVVAAAAVAKKVEWQGCRR